MSNKRIYLIRHGQTDFNLQNIVQGSGVDTSLNNTGMQQAQAFYRHYKDLPFDRVYTSALKRSIQSVQSFIDLGLPHTPLPELNEISWGDFEGKAQSAEQRASYWDTVARWNQGDAHAKIPNGESPHELQIRQKRALELISSRPEEKTILVCMHGRAMKSFLCLLLNEPLMRMEEFQHSNLCLYLLETTANGFTLLKKNDTGHLETPAG